MLVVPFLMSCGQQKRTTEPLPTTRFDLSDIQQMKMSDFVESISLVPLETNDSSLLKRPRKLVIHNGRLVVDDRRGYLFFFDLEGNFLYSTQHLQGPGPEHYRTGLGFTLLPDNGMEVFDAMGLKLLHYDAGLKLVSIHKLPRDILPASGYLKISEGIRLFIGEDTLKWYSLSEEKFVGKSPMPFRHKMMRFQQVPWYERDGTCFYAGNRPQNELYRLDVEKRALVPFHLFDFGEHRFEMDELPSGMDDKYYRNYTDESDDAFVSDKYVDGKRAMCFFWHDKKFCFAYQDFRTGKSGVYYNEWGTDDQLQLPLLYQDDVLYAFAAPEELEYWLDEALLPEEEKVKMDSILEDDNPILIRYKLH